MLDGMLDRLWQRLDDYLAEPAAEAQTHSAR